MKPKEDFFKPPIHYTPVRFLFIEQQTQQFELHFVSLSKCYNNVVFGIKSMC